MAKQPKKKILIVCQHFWPESFRINDIGDFLTLEKNCDIDVLCGIPNYPKGAFYSGYSYFKKRNEKYHGVNIKRVLEIPRGDNSNARIFINYISFPLFSLFHIPRLLTQKYDKIFIYQLSPVMMAITGIIVGKIKKVETIMYVLDLWPENLFSVLAIKSKILRRIITDISHWHYKEADKIIALSEKMKSKLQLVTKKDNRKIIVLPQACEKIYEQEIYDETLAIKFKDTFNIVFTGNISPAQSFETILEAAKMLKNDSIEDIKWIIVGDGMSRQWLEAEVIKYNLSDSFAFEGNHPIDAMPKYSAIADVLVGCLVKSDLLEATIPAKVMSYIASGKPIVLAMDGEVQTLINDDIKCGYVGPAGNSRELYKNIKRIYKTPAEARIKMGERAKEYHLKYLERNIILNKLYNFMFDVK